MYEDPAPAVNAPPRQVAPWTQVLGHSVSARSNGLAFCSCGEQQRRGTEQTPTEWVKAHLRDAWPVLVPRLRGEPLEGWMARISEDYVAACQVELMLAEDLGIGQPIPEG